MYTAIDARRKVLGSSERDPEPGRNLVLTIDENIQFLAERALDHAMEKTQALNGTVVVQDVHTGQILALAIRPTFNPNQFRHTTPELLRDHAVSDVYEPGSTFKLVTYSAAMDSEGGHARRHRSTARAARSRSAGRVIHDNQGEHFGVIPVHKALEESSDVAAVKLALKVGPDRFYQYIHDFGFGTRSERGAARRNARPAAPRQPLGPFVHRLHRHRPGGRRHAAATGHDGFDDRQRRRLSAAACAHAGPIRPSHNSVQKSAAPQVPPPQVAQLSATRSKPVKICPIRFRPARIASSPRWPRPRCAR